MKIERIEIPIATGERLVTQHAFREVLEKRACSVLQPDITHCGGLSEARRIAASPFSPPSGLATGSFNGLHAKSKFLAFGHMAEILKKWTGFTPKNYRGHFQQSGQ